MGVPLPRSASYDLFVALALHPHLVGWRRHTRPLRRATQGRAHRAVLDADEKDDKAMEGVCVARVAILSWQAVLDALCSPLIIMPSMVGPNHGHGHGHGLPAPRRTLAAALRHGGGAKLPSHRLGVSTSKDAGATSGHPVRGSCLHV